MAMAPGSKMVATNVYLEPYLDKGMRIMGERTKRTVAEMIREALKDYLEKHKDVWQGEPKQLKMF